jgi:hypothetical protein
VAAIISRNKIGKRGPGDGQAAVSLRAHDCSLTMTAKQP